MVHVAEIGLTSTDDQVILDRARNEDRTLVSCDHDFVQILFASGDTPALGHLGPRSRHPDIGRTRLLAALPGQLTELLLAGGIATVTPGQVRVRPLPLRPATSG
jgi:predicted nuclease of predicted toxin-antitoxin system